MFWQLEFQIQGVGRVTLSEDSKGESIPDLSPGFRCCQPSLVFLGLYMLHSNLCPHHHVVLSLCLSLCLCYLTESSPSGLRTRPTPV